MSEQEWLIVAKITGVFGIKGWLKIHSFTENDEDVFAFEQLRILNEHTQQSSDVVIEQHQRHGKGFIAKFKGIDDRNQAELLGKQMLQVPKSALPDLEEGEFYWSDLEGMSVWLNASSTQDNVVLLGTVASILETGANDVIVVQPSEASIDDKERLIPYIDDVIESVSLDERGIWVNWDVDF